MRRHLTEQELIEYRFELASDKAMQDASAHLAECELCRAELKKLEGRFAALELLREEIKASEELITRTTEGAAKPRQLGYPVWWKVPAWVAAAALLIAAGLLLRAHLGPGRLDRTEPPPGQRMPAAQQYEIAPAKEISGASIPDQPPFAPASAIELVTLPRREMVELTIYNSADLTLVRERRNLTLKRGWNWLQFMWADTLIDPTSLSIEPRAQADKIQVQQLVFPARLRELGRWLIRSEVSGQVPFEITYFTSGLSWRAFYMGTLAPDEKTMQLEGYVRVNNNSGEDYEKARTRLLVGRVHLLDRIADLAKRRYPYGRAVPTDGGYGGYGWENFARSQVDRILNGRRAEFGDFGGLALEVEGLKRKEIKKEGLSEYFLYTIEGTETLPDKWGKRLLSFEADDIKVESLYKYDEQRWGSQAIRFLSFANDEDHNLGQTPLPNGQVRIYARAGDSGHLKYIGGTAVKYIPVNEDIELNLGPARLVKVQPTLIEFRTDNYVFDKTGKVAGWDEIRTWRIEIANTRALAVKVEITRGFGTAYWSLKLEVEGLEYNKHDATHARFKVDMPPRSKRSFEYTVTTYHGVRAEGRAKMIEERKAAKK